MIKNVVFDIGNVLIAFSWRDVMKDVGIKDEDMDVIANATVRSPYWNELDRGIMTEDEVLQKFIEGAPDHEDDVKRFFARVTDSMPPFDYSKGWLHGVKERGYGVYILSNFSNYNFNTCKPSYTFLEEADGMIISYQHKVVKPERKIYEILLKTYSLDPRECVFIDDREDNIAAAVALGFHGIVFKSYEDANDKLNELLKNEGVFG